MTPTTDLTMERLDGLLSWAERHPVNFVDEPTGSKKAAIVPLDEYRIIIAMAKRTEQAERERDALRAALRLIAGDDPACGCDARQMAIAALAQPTDAGGA